MVAGKILDFHADRPSLMKVYFNLTALAITVQIHRHRHGHGAAARSDVTVRDRCPTDFQRVSTSASASTCFRLVTERVTWSAARERCSSIGARLATIQSAVEQRHLVELARKKYGKSLFDLNLVLHIITLIENLFFSYRAIPSVLRKLL
jgi:hypothetical protein